MRGSITQAFGYFSEGAKIIFKPGYRRFILAPLLINLVIFLLATIYLIHLFQDASAYLLAFLPSWLQWLSWLIGPLLGIAFLVAYGYCFTIITNLLAAPFFGMLAEKIEADVTGMPLVSEPLIRMIPRTLGREFIKFWYFVTRGFVVFLVFLALLLMPGVNILGTCLAILWGCWCLCIQYTDYAADNNQTAFNELRDGLGKQKLTTYGFGGIVLVGSMIPVINILVPPIAVAGATIYWLRVLAPVATAGKIADQRLPPR